MRSRGPVVCLVAVVAFLVPLRSEAGPVECLSDFGDENILCPADIATGAAQPGAVSFPAPTISPPAPEWCGPVSIVCEPASGSVFPFGTTTVSCTGTDTGAANLPSGTCSFDVALTQIPPIPAVGGRGLLLLIVALGGVGVAATRLRA